MSRLAYFWLWLIFLVALDIIVPWFILSSVPEMTGASLFWVLWALAAIISAFLVFLRWQEVKP